MGSKLNITTIDQTQNDASQVQGMTAARITGDNNTTNITDGEAVKNSLLFAMSNSDSTSKTLGDLIGMTGNLASRAFDVAGKQTATALDNIATVSARSTDDITKAYDKASNNGVNLMQVVVVLAVLAAGAVAVFALRK